MPREQNPSTRGPQPVINYGRQQQDSYQREYNINLRKTIIENICSLVMQHGVDLPVETIKEYVRTIWDMEGASSSQVRVSQMSSASSGGSSGSYATYTRRTTVNAIAHIPRPFLAAVLELKSKAKTRMTTNQLIVAIDRFYRTFKKLREIKELLSDVDLMKGRKPLSLMEEKRLLNSMFDAANLFYNEEMDFFIRAAEEIDSATPEALSTQELFAAPNSDDFINQLETSGGDFDSPNINQ